MENVTTLGMSVQLKTDFASAEARIAEELKKEGFGILTEIDVKTTLKNKIDVDFRPYKILGACNPRLAHRALSTDGEVGLLLPCNVTVSEEEAGVITVSIIDPLVMLGVLSHPDLKAVAEEAKERLGRVVAALGS